MNLWKISWNYAMDKGYANLFSCAGIDTDDIESAMIVFEIARKMGFVDSTINVKSKHNYANLNKPKYVLYNTDCVRDKKGKLHLEEVDLEKFQLPKALDIYRRIGVRCIGEPVFYPGFNMCTQPIIVPLKELNPLYDKIVFGERLIN